MYLILIPSTLPKTQLVVPCYILDDFVCIPTSDKVAWPLHLQVQETAALTWEEETVATWRPGQ